jgi:hypothetical protein
MERHRRTWTEGGLSVPKTEHPNVYLKLRTNHSDDNPLRLNPDKGLPKDQAGDFQPHHLKGKHQKTSDQAADQSHLNDRLVGALRLEPSTNRDFLPKGDLDNLVTQQSVNHELSRRRYLPKKPMLRTLRRNDCVRIGSPLEHESARLSQLGLVQDIAHQHGSCCFQQVFAILLSMGSLKKIWSFIEEQVTDADLPLSKVRQDGVFQLRRRGDTQTPLKCLDKQSDIIKFVTFQWLVLAPVFGEAVGKKVSHFKAAKSQILPFVLWEKKDRRGGSGEVYRVEVHPDHHKFDKHEVSIIPSTVYVPE